MVWPTSCAALKGRFFQHPKMHCKGVFLWGCTVRVEFFNKFKIIDKEGFLILICLRKLPLFDNYSWREYFSQFFFVLNLF